MVVWLVLFAIASAAMSPCAQPFGREPAHPARSSLAATSGPRAHRDLFALTNRFAYIPPQCYAKTRDPGQGGANNPCYACHVRSEAPNYVNDSDLQLRFSLPVAAGSNPWTNLLDPPVARAPSTGHDDVLAYVRRSNYFDPDDDGLTLARSLDEVPDDDDAGGTKRRLWSGFRPDARFSFDERGFDHRRDGTFTGWRAFAYYPFLGAFFPTNGSMDDVLIRLDPRLQEDAEGRFDRQVYEINLAIVEALVTRRDVPIDPIDERRFATDVDLDGILGRATHVAFGRAMHYAGRARAGATSGFVPTAGLLPLNTEFLHSVRYLDVAPDGAIRLAARMKELRYAKKVRWLGDADLARIVAQENMEQSRSPDGVAYFVPQGDRGVYNGQGWLFQGFIEAADGALRPQSYEEAVACVGCHGGIGATTDSIFSLPRKVPSASPARGWYHWSQQGLGGLPERRRRDGRYEYSLYLQANRAGDDLRENTEILGRFFDDRGRLRPAEIARPHADIGRLLLPSADRAIALDRAYRAIVREQSFVRGRDGLVVPATHVYERVTVGEPTGIDEAVGPP